MPFARIDLARGNAPSIAPRWAKSCTRGLSGSEGAGWRPLHGHRRACTGEFRLRSEVLDIKRSPDLIYVQVTSTVGNTREQKLAFFRHMADELNRRLGVRREDVFISLVFVDREDWSFGNGEPW